MRLPLTKLGLLDKQGQYAEIKVSNTSKGVEQIKINMTGQEEGATALISNPKVVDLINNAKEKIFTTTTSISLKRDNQESIVLAHNPVFYSRTKYINI